MSGDRHLRCVPDRSTTLQALHSKAHGWPPGAKNPKANHGLAGRRFPNAAGVLFRRALSPSALTGDPQTCSSSGNGTPSAFGASDAPVPRAALRPLRPPSLAPGFGMQRLQRFALVIPATAPCRTVGERVLKTTQLQRPASGRHQDTFKPLGDPQHRGVGRRSQSSAIFLTHQNLAASASARTKQRRRELATEKAEHVPIDLLHHRSRLRFQ